MSKPLSKLERVPLREAWKHEANDFTPWLAEEDNHNTHGRGAGFGRPGAGGRRALGGVSLMGQILTYAEGMGAK